MGDHLGNAVLGESDWHSGHQSALPPLRSLYVDWVSIHIQRSSISLRGFSPSTRVSSLIKNRLMPVRPQETLRPTEPIVIGVCITEMVVTFKYVQIFIDSKFLPSSTLLLLLSPLSSPTAKLGHHFSYKLVSVQSFVYTSEPTAKSPFGAVGKSLPKYYLWVFSGIQIVRSLR